MTLRIAASVSLLLGAVILVAYLDEIGKGPLSSPAARHLRQMKDRATAPAGYEPTTIAAMTAMPRSRRLAEFAPLERRGVTVEGYVQRINRSSDADIHLDFAPGTQGPDGGLAPYLSAEITPGWHRGSSRWRYERLAEAFRPIGGDVAGWDVAPRRVRLSGWLMYDYPYEGAPTVPPWPRHLSVWEIHPVTRIEIWDESRRAFVELPR
jgi:hypothetical protein